MNPYALSAVAVYLLASLVLFAMEQGLRKTAQPSFTGPISGRFFSMAYPAFAAWLFSAFREHKVEALLRFGPVNLLLMLTASAGKLSVTGAFVTAAGFCITMLAIERFFSVDPSFKFALGRRMISAMGAAFSALAWIVFLAQF